MSSAFMKPAVEHAANAEMELYMINLAPFMCLVCGSRTFLIGKAHALSGFTFDSVLRQFYFVCTFYRDARQLITVLTISRRDDSD